MYSINRVTLKGNIGNDPVYRKVDSEKSFTTASLATSRVYTDRSGEKKSDTEWHHLVFFDKNSEKAQHSLKKGAQVFLEGTIRTNKYTDTDGIEQERKTIVVNTFSVESIHN